LEVAVEALSGDSVSFLIRQGHQPSNDQNLLCVAVKSVFLYSSGEAATMKIRMAVDRMSILQQLVSAGLVVADSAAEIMREALYTLKDELWAEKNPNYKGCNPVPITRESICWLCAQGCDLALAGHRDVHLGSELRDMLADLIQLSETVWPVAEAISRGEPYDDVERLVQRGMRGYMAASCTAYTKSSACLLSCQSHTNLNLNWGVFAVTKAYPWGRICSHQGL
jgi:hypothetical protein